MRFSLLFICCFALFSCHKNQDKAFQLLYQDFQNEMVSTPLLRAFLEQKLYFDSMAISIDPQAVEQTSLFAKDYQAKLQHFEADRLDQSLHEHYHNLHSFLDIILKNLDSKKIHQGLPAFYDPMVYLNSLEKSNDLLAIKKGLSIVNNNFRTAIQTMQHVPAEKLETSIRKNTDCFQYLTEVLQAHIRSTGGSKEDKKAALYELTKAKLMLKDYIGFCNSLLFEKRDAISLKKLTNQEPD